MDTLKPISKLKILLLLILVTILLKSLSSKVISTPPIKYNQTVRIRVGQLKDFDYPKYNFAKITGRSLQPSQKGQQYFQIFQKSCSTKLSYIQFERQNQLKWEDKQTIPFVITQIQDIRRMRNLLDVIQHHHFVLVMLKTGQIQVYQYKQDYSQLKAIKTFQVFDSQFQNKLKKAEMRLDPVDDKKQFINGYFVGLQNLLVYFVSNQYVLKIDLNQMTVMLVKGFQKKFDQISNAITLNHQTFAVCHQFEGVKIYKVNAQGLSIQWIQNIQLPNSAVTKVSSRIYKDIQYDMDRKMLFILDKNEGVFVYNVFKMPEKNEWDVQPHKNFIHQANCQVIQLIATRIFISCSKSIYLYQTKNWPKLKHFVMPNRQLKVTQFAIDGDLVALVGRNMIQFLYMNRVSEYQTNLKLQKLILQDKRFISAYENGMTVGKYAIKPISIVCNFDFNKQNNSLSYSTSQSYWVKSTLQAQCSPKYFQQLNLGIKITDNLEQIDYQNDLCLYTTEINVQFYQSSQVPVWPIVVSIVFALVICLGIFGWMARHRMRFDQLKNELKDYQELVSQKASESKKTSQESGGFQMVESNKEGNKQDAQNDLQKQ